jgi:FixJ family two-component response regulator
MRSLGFAVETFGSPAAFLASPNLDRCGCLIADINMPEMTGVELHRRLIDTGRAIPTILITAYPDGIVRRHALKDGVLCYLSKPFDEADLLLCVGEALQQGRSRAADQ